MKIRQSIRRKVFAIFGGFTLFLTLLYSAMNFLIGFMVEDDVLEKILAYEAQAIELTYQKEGRITQPRVDYMKLYLDPHEAPVEIAKAYRNKELGSEVFSGDGVHYHIQHLYFDKNTSAILVAEVTAFLAVSNLSAEIIVTFLFFLSITIILSTWFAYRIAAKTTEPISTLTREVMQQQSQQEPVYFSAGKTPDEIGYLANTIESSLKELRQLVKRESEFNRDVSHELRTPLTVLSNTLSLADGNSLSQDDVTNLKKSAEQMKHIVATLLTLARSESVKYEIIRLRPLLEDSILSFHTKLATQNFNVLLDVADDYELKVNRQLMMLLVNNLIENAINHAAGDELFIRLQERVLYFENKISEEISEDYISKLTEKNVRQSNSSGFGQGLFLVKRILEALHFDYEICGSSSSFQFKIKLDF